MESFICSITPLCNCTDFCDAGATSVLADARWTLESAWRMKRSGNMLAASDSLLMGSIRMKAPVALDVTPISTSLSASRLIVNRFSAVDPQVAEDQAVAVPVDPCRLTAADSYRSCHESSGWG